MRRLIVTAVATGVVGAVQLSSISPAFAAAFELRENSATAMGTAYAGAGANANDPGSLFYNPATLGGVGDWDASFNATGLLLNSSGAFTGTTAAGTPAGGNQKPNDFISDALVPALALRYRLNDQWAVGLSITVPFGESTKYPTGWTGRYYAGTTRLTAYNFTPMVSYQISPTLTFGAGLQVQYVHAHLNEAIDFGTLGVLNSFPGAVPGAMDGSAQLSGDDWQVGYVLGALWKPVDNLTLGLSYRSEMRQTLKGRETFTYDSAGIASTINTLTGAFSDNGGSAEVPLPQIVNASARYDVDPHWSVMAGLEWTGWNTFHRLELVPDNPANPTDVTELHWRGTWFGSVGAEYRPDDRWSFRAGFAYDTAAVRKPYVEPRIPDADRYWMSFGAGYNWDEHTQINLAVSHLFTPHSSINLDAAQAGNALRGYLDGVSNTDATLVGLQLVVH